MKGLITYLLFYSAGMIATHAQTFQCQNGNVEFISEAPLEIIKASTNDLRGIIDQSTNQFAFRIDISSFEGFNNPLQKVHFNENYLESKTFPTAVFSGKIIEDIDLATDGKHIIRAKGKLNIHGVEKERIIRSEIIIKDGKLKINSNFTIVLEEHEIRIPKIVYQKISEVILVSIKAELNMVRT